MALAFEPDFQRFLHDLHQGPRTAGGDARRDAPSSARVAAVDTADHRSGTQGAIASMYRRRRFAVLIALAVGILAILSLIGGTGALSAVASSADASNGAATQTEASHTYVVQPGDTLWSIVGGLGIDGDRRDAVHAVAMANGGPVVFPGQVLRLDAAVQ